MDKWIDKQKDRQIVRPIIAASKVTKQIERWMDRQINRQTDPLDRVIDMHIYTYNRQTDWQRNKYIEGFRYCSRNNKKKFSILCNPSLSTRSTRWSSNTSEQSLLLSGHILATNGNPYSQRGRVDKILKIIGGKHNVCFYLRLPFSGFCCY